MSRIATADDRATVAQLIHEIGFDRVAQYLADLDPASPPAASDPPRLAEAARALLDWAREHTSPRDPNSPHALLVALADALGPEATP
jgi:hypothetical protein